jgi:predicted O-methyltransferase YrrM
MNLDSIVHLASSIPTRPDKRLMWLQSMPSAMDDTALYYRFFHEMVLEYEPLRIVEVGTYLGSSAAHLAYNNRGVVVTIDVNRDATARAKALDLDNLRPITADSMKVIDKVREMGPFDVCFIDTEHNFRQAYGEYVAYRELVRDGGMIFFDDIELGHEMPVLWNMIPEAKRSLKVLHYTGFGVVQKDNKVYVPPLSAVLAKVAARLETSS